MLNRAEIVDKNFIKAVKSGIFPEPHSLTRPYQVGLTAEKALDLFETQIMSRHTDFAARILKERAETFYTIGSSGHEGNAVLGMQTRVSDMAFLHYRSGAFYIQRAKALPGSTPIYDLMLSLSASSEDPISAGRHKVFGSVPLFIPPQTSTIASHLPKAVGAALSIRRAQDLGLETPLPHDAIVICNFGDASSNHSTALSAFNTAAYCQFQKIPCPILFICEDNGIGISVQTPKGWVETHFENHPGLKYFHADGRNLADLFYVSQQAVEFVRNTRSPVFLHVETVRLLGHAGSDVEFQYRSQKQIETGEQDDPLLHSAKIILENNFASPEDILNIYETTRQRVMRTGEIAITRPKFLIREEVRTSVIPQNIRTQAPTLPSQDTRKKLFGDDWNHIERPYHMAKLINWGLQDILSQYPQTIIFGEDVAQKGGVYHVTAGLFSKFGPRRVFNSPLDETSILGMAIGTAHNGFIPIPEIQFLAYVHNAEDQLRGEAATLSFFSSGKYTNPMVMRVAGLAYQKGFGGHFHNDNSLAVFRDIPGVIIACPSNGVDAVKMMRTCVREAYLHGRVCVFVEPIALYMTKDLLTTGDNLWAGVYPPIEESIALGEFYVHGESEELTIISYANGYFLSRQVAEDLKQKKNINAAVIDLRWLAPVDEKKLPQAVKHSKRILIVDECRRTGSQSEYLMTILLENLTADSQRKIARVTADDCFIPLGRAATAPLPSREEIYSKALELFA